MSAPARTTLAVLASILALAAPSARADGGTASGTITVNGTTTTLAYAYARAEKGFFDKTKEDVQVVLSDVPLEDKVVWDTFGRMKLAEAGKLHAFEITIDAEGKPISTMFRHNGFKGTSPSGLSSADVFTKRVFDGKSVDAAYRSAKDHEFFGNTYAFDVAFKAPIMREAKPVPPTGAETAAAQKSPQAKAYAEYLKAIQKEDLAALKKLVSAEMAKNLDQPDAKDMIKLIKVMSATDIRVLKTVETGDKADLTVTGTQDANVTNGVVHMVREGGAWKVQKEEWKN